MNAAGIICEYNPFHNGHLRHIDITRQISGCEYVVAVMAGAFTQRGDPAIIDKWARTRMALRNGVDVVLELPAAFALRPADKFALGGVSILSDVGCRWLSFGCETDDASVLERAAIEMNFESPKLKLAIRQRLEKGCSHARARGEALEDMLGMEPGALNKPNTALAMQYAAVNAQLNLPMRLLPVKRESGYHDLSIAPICSASAIRNAVYEGGEWQSAMPLSARELLYSLVPDAISRPEALDNLALYTLRNAAEERLRLLPDASEGAYLLLKKHAAVASSIRDLLSRAKCKRYTMSRLNRMIAYAVLDLEASRLKAIERPPYIRVLGFRKSAASILKTLSENSPVPLVTDPIRLKGNDCFAIETCVSDLWALTTKSPATRATGQDYTRRIVIEQ